MQEMQVQSLGQEDPLEKEMITHSRFLPWETPKTEELGGLQSTGSQRVRHDLMTEHEGILTTEKTLNDSSYVDSGLQNRYMELIYVDHEALPLPASENGCV